MTAQPKHTPKPISLAIGFTEFGYPTYSVRGLAGEAKRDQAAIVATQERLETCYNALAGLDPAAVGQMREALEEIDATLSAAYDDPCSMEDALEDIDNGCHGNEAADIRADGAWEKVRAALARLRGEEA